MAIQYYNVTSTGQKYALDKSTGQATPVSAFPAGASIITWTGNGLPPDLQNAGVSSTGTSSPNPFSANAPSIAYGAVNTNQPAPIYVPPTANPAPGYTAPAPSVVSGATPAAPATAAGTGTIKVGSTGNPELDKILQSLAGVGENILKSGYTIPDTLKITPALVGTFLSWAHQAVDPQTQQLLSAKAADVNASLKNMQQQFEASQGQTVQDFGTALATEQNTAGATGTAFSGQRALNERNMAASTNRSLASLDASYAANAGSVLRSGAADVGSANAGAFQLPTLVGGRVGIEGGARGSFTPGNTLDFGYNPSLYTAGNIPTAQNTSLNNLQSNYLSQYGTLAATNSNGTRSVNDLLGMISGKPAGAGLM